MWQAACPVYVAAIREVNRRSEKAEDKDDTRRRQGSGHEALKCKEHFVDKLPNVNFCILVHTIY